MTRETKQEIVAAMRQYQEQKKLSQNKLATMIGLSSAHMSYVFNEDMWEKVSEDLWRKLKTRFCPTTWKIYQTANFRAIQKMCTHAQKDSITECISDYTGAGKTVALKSYGAANPNAFYVQADQLMSNKEFIREIQRALGMSVEGTAREMLMAVVATLEKIESPVLLIDEADKLKDSCLMSLKVLYDRLENRCGFVTAGTEVLKNKIHKLALKDKLGYREFKRRFANYARPLRRFDTKNNAIREEIAYICNDQGIEDASQIEKIIELADNYGSLYNLIKDFQKLNERNERQHEEPQPAEAA